ncbi:exodeoxyribonuclease V subunit gamma [Methylomonas sp. ZR1]|uniref:exodeoxyribonuclease V subunit gamma n=1 Tax=Methylomonas sp. ZR1 TaxID=1797072 RepID=UPI001491283D|nr:exodeoxyribonuclease V subunit gamma [Methylomonas sp. ZR1]NOV28308.1 exodeoxyribonuclease V subunit gamma [Methylomonas sp. ZR1]
MTESNHISPLDSGIAVIHSNQLEELLDVVEYWLRQHPLAPLENEIFLVQSNGMGQWLKQNLAQNALLGIVAATKVQLPSLFIWSAYRAVLGEQIPKEQLLAKAPLIWRLYRLLPKLITQSGFETLASFLADDSNSRKRYQLAEQLADLFDQYQVYRSDWMSDWAEGNDVLRNAHGEIKPLPEQQHWQALLWRAVLKDLGEESMLFASRASVHAQFMTHIDTLEQRPAGIPRRIILFGLSSLPQQSLEVLAKLGKFCQIVLFVHNPCQHYWADIIEDKELLKAERRRQSYKAGMTSSLTVEELHLHAPPLLAAWGKQGRDYIRLLDHFDETQHYKHWHWPQNKIDLFKDYGELGQRSLLQHLQQSILDLEPLPEEPMLLPAADDSIAFHIAHSPQREVEILYDQLLARFAAAKQHREPLYPRDVIVMVPDINQYAPHIRAVFGQIQADDPRYIPYSLADQQQRGQNPMLVAVEALLNLPESRFAVSEFLGLLEVPALRARFAIDEAAIPKLHQWIEEAGIRWGLNAEQRTQAVSMPSHLEANTWQFGLRRMLLGYAVGTGEAFAQIEPYAEIGGLEAQWVGDLSFLLESLEKYALLLKREQNIKDWQRTLLALLEDLFSVSNDQERKTLEILTSSLAKWGQSCEQAGLMETDTMPINVVREAWLSSVDEPSLHQRFLSGRVNFCTLMPMRAIPFRLICLLGMNDGDYPRNQQAPSFDLMSHRGQYRPGDRSRRQDDQYLFLEAILSARQQLYISWVGRSIRDNSERPPSVLISQLREVLAQGWRLADEVSLLASLTVEHPLQPFSLAYVLQNRDPRLFTYAREWYEPATDSHLSERSVPNPEEKGFTLTLESLARFLKAPVKAFCNHTLKFGFDEETVTSEDHEPFGFDALQAYVLSEALLQRLNSEQANGADLDDTAAFFTQQQSAMAQQGLLPLGGFAQATYDAISEPVKLAWQQYQAILPVWSSELEAHATHLPPFTLADGVTVQLTGDLSQLRRSSDQQGDGLIYLTAQRLINKDKTLKYPNLLLHWVQHLAACADHLPVQTLVIAADTVIEIPAIDQAEAYAHLQSLVEAYHQGMQAPLPVACKTAFAWLAAAANSDQDKALEKAISRYQGDDWTPGEVDYDAYLTRFFPDFASLNQSPQETAQKSGQNTDQDKAFQYWVETLYQPAFNQIQQTEIAQGASE